MAPSSLIMPTPNNTRLPLQNLILRPRCSILDLGKLTSASLRPITECCVASLQYGFSSVALGDSMGGIDEIPQGRPGTARLQLNPGLPVSSTLSEHDKFLLSGRAAMVEPTPPAMSHISEQLLVCRLHICNGIRITVRRKTS
ncbi:uncharacterized protein V6R79_000209 [Siganus canaliculatus]